MPRDLSELSVDTYRGLEIDHEPENIITASHRDHWFQIYEPNSTGWLFRVRMAVHWEFAIKVIPSGTDPIDACRVLARDLGLRWVHGLIDLGRWERDKIDEQVRDGEWDPEANESSLNDDDLRFELLSALRTMNRDQTSSGDVYDLDVLGVTDVLKVRLGRVRGVLSEMLLEGLIDDTSATYGHGAEDGACRITGDGLRELKRLEERRSLSASPQSDPPSAHEYDVFICHATEDKESFVRPLANALAERSLRIWYDEFELRIGDSLRQKIDHGIARSDYGIVVLSEAFFAKKWPQYELDGLVTRAVGGKSVILPIWHGVAHDQVAAYSPSLADKVARSTADLTIDEIADEIASIVGPDT